jgi:hypothetical protein
VGSDEIIDHLADIGESADDYCMRMNDIIANDRYVVILTQISAKKGSASLDTTYVLLGRVAEDRIREVWSIPMEPAAVASFWNQSAPSHLERPQLLTA